MCRIILSDTCHTLTITGTTIPAPSHPCRVTATHWKIVGLVNFPLQWHHKGRDGVSNHQPHDCLLNRLFRHRSKKILKLRVTGLCEGNSPVTGEFPTQRASYAENVSIWWRHHALQVSRSDLVVRQGTSRVVSVMTVRATCPFITSVGFLTRANAPYQSWMEMARSFTWLNLQR